MILDMLADARTMELAVRERELNQRQQWYESAAIERLERALRRARGRLQLTPTNRAPAR